MHYVFNHVDILIKYHNGANEDWDGARLMSVRVNPKRFNTTFSFSLNDCLKLCFYLPLQSNSSSLAEGRVLNVQNVCCTHGWENEVKFVGGLLVIWSVQVNLLLLST